MSKQPNVHKYCGEYALQRYDFQKTGLILQYDKNLLSLLYDRKNIQIHATAKILCELQKLSHLVSNNYGWLFVLLMHVWNPYFIWIYCILTQHGKNLLYHRGNLSLNYVRLRICHSACQWARARTSKRQSQLLMGVNYFADNSKCPHDATLDEMLQLLNYLIIKYY